MFSRAEQAHAPAACVCSSMSVLPPPKDHLLANIVKTSFSRASNLRTGTRLRQPQSAFSRAQISQAYPNLLFPHVEDFTVG